MHLLHEAEWLHASLYGSCLSL